ncbi:MAG: hypothetical protein R3B47_06870 [Bacteroidia bacterium]
MADKQLKAALDAGDDTALLARKRELGWSCLVWPSKRASAL